MQLKWIKVTKYQIISGNKGCQIFPKYLSKYSGNRSQSTLRSVRKTIKTLSVLKILVSKRNDLQTWILDESPEELGVAGRQATSSIRRCGTRHFHRLVDKNICEGTLTEATPPTSDQDTTTRCTHTYVRDRESHMHDFSARLIRFKRISQMLVESFVSTLDEPCNWSWPLAQLVCEMFNCSESF